jgi:hypothetical protein
MSRPDFAYTDVTRLADGDLKFLVENFPQPGRSYEEIAQLIHQLPTTLESMLDSDFVFDKILGQRRFLIDISPFLLFNVLLRRILTGERTAKERGVINYLANLLSLFVRTDRLYRVQQYDQETHENFVELIEEATYGDSRRQFLVYAHIGNYALFLTGLFPEWIEYRHRYQRRPVSPAFYTDLGRAYFERAAAHALAREYRLNEVFFRLAFMFDHYKSALNQLANRYLLAQ